MGSIIKTYNPTTDGSIMKSQLQLTYIGYNQTANGNFTINNPQIDYSFLNPSGGGLIGVHVEVSVTVAIKIGTISGATVTIGDYVFTYPLTRLTSATTGMLTLSSSPSNKTVTLSNIFNSYNSSAATSSVSFVVKNITAYFFHSMLSQHGIDTWKTYHKQGRSHENDAYVDVYEITTQSTQSNLATITLNAPPTFGVNLSYSPSGSYKYANYTTAIATLVNISPKYGATFKSASLQIGAQVSTVNTSTNNPSILLNTTGTFAPKITLTDSRNQTSTTTLSNITVTSPVKPSITQLTGVRLDADNKVDDSGVKLLIIMKASKDTNVASFSAPTTSCKRTDTDGAITYSITWYSTATVSSNTYTFSNQISNWASISNEATVYGLITAATDIIKGDYGYTVAVTPKTSTTNSSTLTGTTATVVFPPAYYTLDFKAGGKGIAFGGPSITNEFDCHMNAYFEGTKYFYINENAPDNYYDKLIYNLFKSFGWITDSDTSGLTD